MRYTGVRDRGTASLPSSRSLARQCYCRKVKTATYLGVPALSLRWATLLALALTSGEAAGQASVSGIVYDSVARSPLKGALVQLVHVDSMGGRTVVADSLGQ